MKILKTSIIVLIIILLSTLYIPVSYAAMHQTTGQEMTAQKSVKKTGKHITKKIKKSKKKKKLKKKKVVAPPSNVQQDVAPLIEAPTTHKVLIQSFAFLPKTITVKKGDTVEFTQKDSVGHTVSTDPHPEHTQLPDFSSSVLSLDQKYSYTFTKTGTWTYHCSPHPFMTGTVIVTELD